MHAVSKPMRAWRDVLERHQADVRSELVRYRGHLAAQCRTRGARRTRGGYRERHGGRVSLGLFQPRAGALNCAGRGLRTSNALAARAAATTAAYRARRCPWYLATASAASSGPSTDLPLVKDAPDGFPPALNTSLTVYPRGILPAMEVQFIVEEAGCSSCAAVVGRVISEHGTVGEIQIDEDADVALVRADLPEAFGAEDLNVVLAHVSDGAGHAYRVRPGSWQAGESPRG